MKQKQENIYENNLEAIKVIKLDKRVTDTASDLLQFHPHINSDRDPLNEPSLPIVTQSSFIIHLNDIEWPKGRPLTATIPAVCKANNIIIPSDRRVIKQLEFIPLSIIAPVKYEENQSEVSEIVAAFINSEPHRRRFLALHGTLSTEDPDIDRFFLDSGDRLTLIGRRHGERRALKLIKNRNVDNSTARKSMLMLIVIEYELTPPPQVTAVTDKNDPLGESILQSIPSINHQIISEEKEIDELLGEETLQSLSISHAAIEAGGKTKDNTVARVIPKGSTCHLLRVRMFVCDCGIINNSLNERIDPDEVVNFMLKCLNEISIFYKKYQITTQFDHYPLLVSSLTPQEKSEQTTDTEKTLSSESNPPLPDAIKMLFNEYRISLIDTDAFKVKRMSGGSPEPLTHGLSPLRRNNLKIVLTLGFPRDIMANMAKNLSVVIPAEIGYTIVIAIENDDELNVTDLIIEPDVLNNEKNILLSELKKGLNLVQEHVLEKWQRASKIQQTMLNEGKILLCELGEQWMEAYTNLRMKKLQSTQSISLNQISEKLKKTADQMRNTVNLYSSNNKGLALFIDALEKLGNDLVNSKLEQSKRKESVDAYRMGYSNSFFHAQDTIEERLWIKISNMKIEEELKIFGL